MWTRATQPNGHARCNGTEHRRRVTYDEFRAHKLFACLDGLRALSILPVIWHHTMPSWVTGPLRFAGAEGVTLFFAISGFLITTLLLRERERHGGIDLKAFYVRRSLRIFPLYYAVLLLYVVVVTVFERDSADGAEFYSNLVYFATYTSNLFVALNERVIFYFAWSLATEEQYYLLWPPILVLLGASSRWAPAALLSLIIVACMTAEAASSVTLAKLPVAIVAGSLLAIILNDRSGYGLLAAALDRSAATWVIIGLLIASFVVPGWPASLRHCLFALLVVGCVVNERHAFARFLQLRVLVYIGGISYGMYLLHMLCKHVASRFIATLGGNPDSLLLFLLTIPVAILAATVSYRYYESWFLRAKAPYQRNE